MKCQILFSRKNIISFSSVESAHSMVSVNERSYSMLKSEGLDYLCSVISTITIDLRNIDCRTMKVCLEDAVLIDCKFPFYLIQKIHYVIMLQVPYSLYQLNVFGYFFLNMCKCLNSSKYETQISQSICTVGYVHGFGIFCK